VCRGWISSRAVVNGLCDGQTNANYPRGVGIEQEGNIFACAVFTILRSTMKSGREKVNCLYLGVWIIVCKQHYDTFYESKYRKDAALKWCVKLFKR
jgi:hypothetical protein